MHGTTLITNTLIERKGAKTALVTTKGMRDALDIGREWRYDIYDLEIELPKPLIDADCRVEIDERLNASGAVTTALSDDELDRMAAMLGALDVKSVAVSLLHSYVNTDHEKKVAARLKQALPGLSVSLSSDLAREIKEFERTSTVAANAYVKPLVVLTCMNSARALPRSSPVFPCASWCRAAASVPRNRELNRRSCCWNPVRPPA